MKTSTYNIIGIILICGFITSCGGIYAEHYGVSDTISESLNLKFYRATYLPTKPSFRLQDSTIVKIDTTWAEIIWYINKKAEYENHEEQGHNFIITTNEKEFKFAFSLADETNEGSVRPGGDLTMHPIVLKDTLAVIVTERNRDPQIGWTKPIRTDTLIFIKQ